MNLTKSSNPVFGAKTFERFQTGSFIDSETMTIRGTVNKTLVSFLLLVASASYTWKIAMQSAENSAIMPFLIIGGIGALITALIVSFRPKAAPIGTPIYAILEGLLLGGISARYAALYNGIVIQAVALTFLTFFVMLFLYRTGMIKVTNKFRTGVMVATASIFLFYFISFLLSLFGLNVGVFNGGLGIIISLVIVAIAALNLVLDFDFIDRAAQQNAPKFMEWYGAFGLMVTLVWLYIEILRLLSRIASRD